VGISLSDSPTFPGSVPLLQRGGKVIGEDKRPQPLGTLSKKKIV